MCLVTKSVLRLMTGAILLAAMVSSPALGEVPSPQPATAPESTGDPGTELVASFYRALLQDSPPTLDQEKSLFREEQWMRDKLISDGLGTARDPVVLTFFRMHKDRFVPAHMKSPMQIAISSTFNFPRTAGHVIQKDKPSVQPDGAVLVFFPDDASAHPVHLREVIFAIRGRIDASGIMLGGFGGKLIGDEFFGWK